MEIKETKQKELKLLEESIQTTRQGYRFVKENLHTEEINPDDEEDGIEEGIGSFDPTRYLNRKEKMEWNRLSERRKRQFIEQGIKASGVQCSRQKTEQKIGKIFREEQLQQDLATTTSLNRRKQPSFYPSGKNTETVEGSKEDTMRRNQAPNPSSENIAKQGGSSVPGTFAVPATEVTATTTSSIATTATTTANGAATGGVSLAVQAGKKTADMFKEALASRAMAAQQAQQKIQEQDTVGAFPKPVAYVSAAIASVMASMAAMVIQIVTSFLSALMAIIATILPLIIVICTVVVIFVSIFASVTSTNGAGYNLPIFVTEDMMEAFFETQEKDGIPVSSGVAQLIAESGFGLYGPGGSSGEGLSQLAYEYKNLFGIKYFDSDSFASGAVDMSTGEEVNGENLEIIAGFSVYPNYAACIKQRAWMLSREPYASHVSPYLNQNDGHYTHQQARAFIYGIRSAGWATSSAYVSRCVQLMEDYNLYQFDNMTLEEYKNGVQSGGGSYNGVITPSMQAIVNIAQSNTGTYPCTPDMCAAWVTGVYQAAGATTLPYGDAIDMWNTYKSTGSTSMENIPPGAIVCGSGSGYMGSLYGHVGIYLGNGMVANNKGYHSLETLEEWCSWQTAVCQGHQGWIGWVYPGGVPTE